MPMVTVEASVNWRGSSGKVAVGSPPPPPSRRRTPTWSRTGARRAGCCAGSGGPRRPCPARRRSRRLTSTRSATERAIWAPEPCAMARRASFSAGTSLTPSPTMPRSARPAVRAVDDRALAVRARCARRPAPPSRPRAVRSASSGRRSPSSAGAVAGHAGVAGDRPDGRRRVAGQHLQDDVLVGEEGDRLGGVGAQPLGQRRPPRAAARRRGTAHRAAASGSGASVRPSASTRRPAPASSRARRRGRRRRRRSARAHPARAARRRGPARSSAGARRTAPGRATWRGVASASAASCDRLQGQVARRRAGGVARERPRQRGLVRAVGRHQPDHAQRRLGQRAGLVGAARRRPRPATRSR